MIELTKEQEEEWIQFGEEASQRTSKGPLHNKEFGTGKNRYEVHFKGFSVYQDRYEDINETWFDYWIADNLEHLDDQIGEEKIDNQHLLNPKARSLLIETKIDCTKSMISNFEKSYYGTKLDFVNGLMNCKRW